MVVRLVQTLAREAWMALSLDVSSADVAYREGLGKTAPATQVPSGRRMRAAGQSLRNQKEPVLRLKTASCFCETWICASSPRWRRCPARMAGAQVGEEGGEKALRALTSSSRMMSGALRMVRAMATRCFSPPLSFSPRSPTCVSYPVEIAHFPQVTVINLFSVTRWARKRWNRGQRE